VLVEQQRVLDVLVGQSTACIEDDGGRIHGGKGGDREQEDQRRVNHD